MSEELKKCPWCGSEADVYRSSLGCQVTCKATDSNWHGTPGVADEWCHHESDAWFRSKKEAVEHWNHRPIEDQLRKENQELREKLHQADESIEFCNDCRTSDDLSKLKEFARFVIRTEIWGCVGIDGMDLQDLAEKLGLIVPVIATEEDVDEDSDYEVRDKIYKFSQVLEESKGE